MQNCQFLYLRESFGYNRELFVCPSRGHRVAIGRLRVCICSILAFYQIRDENRAKLKISYSCGHRVSKSARYDATFNKGADKLRGERKVDQRLSFLYMDSTVTIPLLNRNFKLLACFYNCTGWFVFDLGGTQIVDFLTHRLFYFDLLWSLDFPLLEIFQVEVI